ncbi:hypothetical protein O1611_g10474 [Lasiodiplodia mahajangana]|uniref:Uncharacterized protein n=1 Tax=Lasiodiplodia mahajangana TaxID=1108764 RepID=A0ACC2IY35_9PEZI|nr:hypothetical protein O1611_g10474 [Lasiodiplodia mahajangana]
MLEHKAQALTRALTQALARALAYASSSAKVENLLCNTCADRLVLAKPLTSIAGCTHLPGDEGWPSLDDWAELNRTLSGQLIVTVPQASVCHTTPYNLYSESACQELAQEWSLADTFLPQPAGIMNPYYQNQSCDPYTAISQPCQLGNYAAYSINVTGAGDVVSGIKFAKAHNIRLVIKTTGHDYLGRSSGAGALSLWMWNLKTADFIPDYQRNWYSGEALKLGAGVAAGEVYEAAAATGHRVVIRC